MLKKTDDCKTLLWDQFVKAPPVNYSLMALLSLTQAMMGSVSSTVSSYGVIKDAKLGSENTTSRVPSPEFISTSWLHVLIKNLIKDLFPPSKHRFTWENLSVWNRSPENYLTVNISLP